MVAPFQANYVVRLHTKLNRRPNMDARCAFQSTFHFEVVLFVAKGNLNTGGIMVFVSAYSNYITLPPNNTDISPVGVLPLLVDVDCLIERPSELYGEFYSDA